VLLEITNLHLSVGGKSKSIKGAKGTKGTSDSRKRSLCQNFSLSLDSGERCALLGPNGSGKTSLLNSLLGLTPIDEGNIIVNGSNLRQLSPSEIAQQLGMLFQEQSDTMPATVLETVLLGRHPYASHWLLDNKDDVDLAYQALEELELMELKDRDIRSLSGGERQRLAIASLLCQAPKLYLLDEPSNHLDLAFQVKALELLCIKTSKGDAALIMATHDINLASRFCDRVLLMMGNGEILYGNQEEILTANNLSEAFHHPIRVIDSNAGRYFFPS